MFYKPHLLEATCHHDGLENITTSALKVVVGTVSSGSQIIAKT